MCIEMLNTILIKRGVIGWGGGARVGYEGVEGGRGGAKVPF